MLKDSEVDEDTLFYPPQAGDHEEMPKSKPQADIQTASSSGDAPALVEKPSDARSCGDAFAPPQGCSQALVEDMRKGHAQGRRKLGRDRPVRGDLSMREKWATAASVVVVERDAQGMREPGRDQLERSHLCMRRVWAVATSVVVAEREVQGGREPICDQL